jgi:hypothetical protein
MAGIRSCYILTRKIPLDQNLVDCSLDSLYEEKISFFLFFFWTSELHISQVFQEHQVCPILTPYEPMVNFCLKWILTPKGPKAIFRPFLKFGQAILKAIFIKNS